MEGSARRGQHVEALEEDALATLQSIHISINALNSIVSFVVDTLTHHRNILGKIQDKMEALMTQFEVIQLWPPPPTSLSQQSQLIVASSTHHDATPRLDLNVPIENSVIEDEVLVNLPSTNK